MAKVFHRYAGLEENRPPRVEVQPFTDDEFEKFNQLYFMDEEGFNRSIWPEDDMARLFATAKLGVERAR